jgi:hypothetical protein
MGKKVRNYQVRNLFVLKFKVKKAKNHFRANFKVTEGSKQIFKVTKIEMTSLLSNLSQSSILIVKIKLCQFKFRHFEPSHLELVRN